MKKVLLVLIIVFAAIIRLWQLGAVPLSPDWDEVALGYNAYSIVHTGKDEYGKFLPVVLRSYDDYKPALYSYLVIPSILMFDLTVFAVRLPSAVFGVLTILAVYFLVQELFPEGIEFSPRKKVDKESLGLVISFFLAISPWHIQFSRIAFESNIGLSLNIFAILFFLKGIKKPILLCASAACFALSLYAYQSEKVFVPMIALVLISIYWKELFHISKKFLAGAVLVGFILCLPLGIFLLTNKDALARAQGVSILATKTDLLKYSIINNEHDKQEHNILGEIFDNRRVVYGITVLQNYLSHYNPDWLFIEGDPNNPRHHAPEMGLLYIGLLPFLFIGIYSLFFGKEKNGISRNTKLLIVLWFLVAPLPAAVTNGVPHAVRTLNFLPTFQLFIGLGILTSYYFIQEKISLKHIQYILYGVSIVVFLFNFSYYLDQYFIQQNYAHALDWQYGYEQVLNYVAPREGNYKKIIVSNDHDFSQSYMFFLFYLKYDPAKYLAGGGTSSGKFEGMGNHFGNYEFRPIAYKNEDHGVLLVGSDKDFPELYKTVFEVDYPNGQRAMRVVEKD